MRPTESSMGGLDCTDGKNRKSTGVPELLSGEEGNIQTEGKSERRVRGDRQPPYNAHLKRIHTCVKYGSKDAEYVKGKVLGRGAGPVGARSGHAGQKSSHALERSLVDKQKEEKKNQTGVMLKERDTLRFLRNYLAGACRGATCSARGSGESAHSIHEINRLCAK